MSKKVKYKAPKGYSHVTAYLRVRDAAAALDFYRAAFGAKEQYRLLMPDGKIGHAELDFGDARVMLSEEYPERGLPGPQSLGGTTVALTIYVADADAVFERAKAAGAKVRKALADQFYGDRTGQLEDPFGHLWAVQTRIHDMSPKKMQKRLNELMAAPKAEPAKPKPTSEQKSEKKG